MPKSRSKLRRPARHRSACNIPISGKPAPIAQTASSLCMPARNVIDLPIEIRQPKLWYPAGYGDQPLYEFTAQVSRGRARPPTNATIKTGLRSIVLDRHLDQWGRSL